MINIEEIAKLKFISAYGISLDQIPNKTEFLWEYDPTDYSQSLLLSEIEMPCQYHGLTISRSKKGIYISKSSQSILLSADHTGMHIHSEFPGFSIVHEQGFFTAQDLTIFSIQDLWNNIKGKSTFFPQISVREQIIWKDNNFFYVSPEIPSSEQRKFPCPMMKWDYFHQFSKEGLKQAVQQLNRNPYGSIILVSFWNSNVYAVPIAIKYRLMKTICFSENCIDMCKHFLQKEYVLEMDIFQDQVIKDHESGTDASSGIAFQKILDKSIDRICQLSGYSAVHDVPIALYRVDDGTINPYELDIQWHDIPEEKHAFIFRTLIYQTVKHDLNLTAIQRF